MTKRGRKSSASLAIASISSAVAALPSHAKAPSDFDAKSKARWDEIVRDWPVDHWRPSDLLLLRDMVLTEGYVRDCDALIKREGMTVETTHGGMMSHPAVIQRRQHLQTIVQLQRALRLCPSTRYQPQAAKLRDRTTAGSARPWETKKA